jgi:hypothetical protein
MTTQPELDRTLHPLERQRHGDDRLAVSAGNYLDLLHYPRTT